MTSAGMHSAAGRPREPIEVIVVCRSELLLMGLERLLAPEAGISVITYSKLPERSGERAEAAPELELEGEDRWPLRGRPGGPTRVAVLSDRAVPDVAADCEGALGWLADSAVLLSSRPDVSDLLGALGAGVRSFATEAEGPDALVSAIRSAARRRVYLSPQILELLVEWLGEREQSHPEERRSRENDLLRLLAEGRSTSEIAERLGIAPKTVRNRVSKLYRRLGVHSRAAAVRLAEERGMLDPRDPGRV